MASKKITRQLSIFINGKEVKNSLGGIGREIAKVKKLLKEANDPKDIKKHKAELDRLGKAYGSVKEEIYGTNTVVKQTKTSTLNLIKAFAGGTIIASVLKSGYRAAKQFVNESVLLAEEAKGVEYAFKQIEGSGEILERARTATRGLITNLDIKKAANVFKNFKIDMEPFPELLEFVATRAAQTGEKFDGMLNSLVEGLSKESKLRIDNLGISQKELNAELEKTPNFVQAVANIAKKELTSAGSILDDAADSSLKWNVSLENLQLRIGKLALKSGLIKDIKSAGASFLDAIAPADRFSEKLRQQQFETNTLVGAITRANQSQEIRKKLINELQTKYPNFLKNLDTEKVTNEQLKSRLKDVNTEYRERIKLEALKEVSADKQQEGVEAFKRELELNKEIAALRLNSKKEITRTDQEIAEWYARDNNDKIVGATNENLRTVISIAKKLNEINEAKEKQIQISEELLELDKKASEFIVVTKYTNDNEDEERDGDGDGDGDDDTGNLTPEDQKILDSKKKLQEYLDQFDAEQKIIKQVLKLEDDEAKQLEEELNLEAKFARLEAEAFGEQELLERLAESKKKALQNIEDKYDKIKAEKDKKEKEAQLKRDEQHNKKQVAARKKLKADIINGVIALAGQETKIGQALVAAKGVMAAKEMLIQLGILKGKAAVAVADGTMATAVGAANTAKVGFPQNIPLLIGFAAQAVAIISAIKSATNATNTIKGFYKGGPTGNKAIYNDEYGAVTGVVHEDEWVAPKWMNESPLYAPTIQWLEKERKKEKGQFFEGGNTSSASNNNEILDDVETDNNSDESINLATEIFRLNNLLSVGIKTGEILIGDEQIQQFNERNELLTETREEAKIK